MAVQVAQASSLSYNSQDGCATSLGGTPMYLFEVIATRHSYREGFTDNRVPREDLKKIVQAGIQAPSGKNEQTTSFVIIDDPKLLAEVATIVDRPACNTAKAMIACVVDFR